MIKQEYDLSLKSKHIKPEAEMTLYRDEGLYDPNKSQRQNCEKFILKPDPIVGLDRIIGVHPRFNSGAVFFNKDPKLSSEIIFSQANVLLGLHAQLQKQRLFSEESSKQSIVKLLVVHGYACSFTIEPSVAKQKSAT